MYNWSKTCKQQIQARAPNGPHTNVQLQLKLCQQEMLSPVTESSFAQFTLFPVKRNKHRFDLRLYLSYRFRLRGGGGETFPSLIRGSVSYSTPVPICVRRAKLPSNVFLRPSAPMTTSKSNSDTGWLEGRTSARHPGPGKEHNHHL